MFENIDPFRIFFSSSQLFLLPSPTVTWELPFAFEQPVLRGMVPLFLSFFFFFSSPPPSPGSCHALLQRIF